MGTGKSQPIGHLPRSPLEPLALGLRFSDSQLTPMIDSINHVHNYKITLVLRIIIEILGYQA